MYRPEDGHIIAETCSVNLNMITSIYTLLISEVKIHVRKVNVKLINITYNLSH